MSEFNPKKIDTSIINSGRKYEQGDGVQPNLFNDIVEGVAYVDEEMQALTEQPDTSEASLVGEPTVTLVNTVYNGRTHKKFKFSRLKGEQGEQGNLIFATTEMMDGYTENGQPNLNQDLQYIVVNKIDSSGYSRSPQANDYIIAENFTTNDIFALFRVDYILANRYYCTKIMRLTGQKGANGVGLPSVTVADAGKFAVVGESGTWEAKTIPFAEGGEF